MGEGPEDPAEALRRMRQQGDVRPLDGDGENGGIAGHATEESGEVGKLATEYLEKSYAAIEKVRAALAHVQNFSAQVGIESMKIQGIDRTGAESVPIDPRTLTGTDLMKQMRNDLPVVEALIRVFGDRDRFEAIIRELEEARKALLSSQAPAAPEQKKP